MIYTGREGEERREKIQYSQSEVIFFSRIKAQTRLRLIVCSNRLISIEMLLNKQHIRWNDFPHVTQTVLISTSSLA